MDHLINLNFNKIIYKAIKGMILNNIKNIFNISKLVNILNLMIIIFKKLMYEI